MALREADRRHGGSHATAISRTPWVPTSQHCGITPRWLVRLLPWVPVDAGIYRLNRVRNPESVGVAVPEHGEPELPQAYVDYEDNPREYFLGAISTIVSVRTRVSDLHSNPHDQTREQLRLVIEIVKER